MVDQPTNPNRRRPRALRAQEDIPAPAAPPIEGEVAETLPRLGGGTHGVETAQSTPQPAFIQPSPIRGTSSSSLFISTSAVPPPPDSPPTSSDEERLDSGPVVVSPAPAELSFATGQPSVVVTGDAPGVVAARIRLAAIADLERVVNRFEELQIDDATAWEVHIIHYSVIPYLRWARRALQLRPAPELVAIDEMASILPYDALYRSRPAGH